MIDIRNLKADIDEYLGKGITLPSFDNIVEQYVTVKFGGLRQATLQQLNPDADNYNDLVAQLDEEIEQVRSYYTEEGKAGRARLEQKFNDLKARVSAAKKAAITLVENTSVEITAATLPGAIGAAAPNPAKIALDVKSVGSRVKTLIDNLLKEISTALGIAIELGLDDTEFIKDMFVFVEKFISDQEEAVEESENAESQANAAVAATDGSLTFNGIGTAAIQETARGFDLGSLPIDSGKLNEIYDRFNFFIDENSFNALLEYNAYLIENNISVTF